MLLPTYREILERDKKLNVQSDLSAELAAAYVHRVTQAPLGETSLCCTHPSADNAVTVTVSVANLQRVKFPYELLKKLPNFD